jgi:hypothetical protein
MSNSKDLSEVINPGTITSTLTGNVTGAVTGNITGNITGNVTGNLTGAVTGTVNGLTPQASNMQPHNLIINGAMQVAQRGTSAVTATTTAAYRTVDRFKTDIDGSDGGDFSHAQSTDVPSGQGFQYSSKFTTVTQASQPTSEVNRHQLYSLLEEQDAFHLEWGTSNAKTCTLSFWVKGSVTGTYGFIFGHYGSGGTYFYYTNYTINSANTWEKKTITVAGPTSGGNNSGGNNFGLRVEWILGVGSDAETGTLNEWTTSSTMRTAANTVYLPENSGATLYLTGVQLEVGSTASSFAHENYGDTLQKCQRYYQKTYSQGVYAGANDGMGCVSFIPINSTDDVNVNFVSRMRDAPLITTYRKNGTATGSAQRSNNGAVYMNITINGISDVGLNILPAASASFTYRFHYLADAEL